MEKKLSLAEPLGGGGGDKGGSAIVLTFRKYFFESTPNSLKNLKTIKVLQLLSTHSCTSSKSFKHTQLYQLTLNYILKG